MEYPSLDKPKAGAFRFNTDSSQLEIYDGNQWTGILSTSPEQQTGGTRGLLAGGYTGSNIDIIDVINVDSTGDATDFGDLTSSRRPGQNAAASRTRAIWMGGRASPINYNVIDYVTIASTGDAADFGDLVTGRGSFAVVSSATRGLCASGSKTESPSDAAMTNTIDYVTIAATGNAVEFGDTYVGTFKASGAQSPTRGLFMGGYTPTEINTIQYITISTTGNSADFGDLTQTGRGGGGGGNSVRAVLAGRQRYPSTTGVQTIDYVNIATLGDAKDFGDCITGTGRASTSCSSTRVVYSAGTYDTNPVTLEHFQIATTGNAQDFGDLTSGRWGASGTSNGHGGL